MFISWIDEFQYILCSVDVKEDEKKEEPELETEHVDEDLEETGDIEDLARGMTEVNS